MWILENAPTDEVFTHIDDDTGEVRHFNATQMAKAAPVYQAQGLLQLVTAAIEEDFIEFILQRRGIEPPRVDRLVEPYLSRPIIGACMEDGSVLTVDGHHRLVARHRKGMPTYEIYLFPKYLWVSFLIHDLPTEIARWAAGQTTGR